MKKYRTFAEFWPHYVGEHRSKANRRIHFVGTCLGLFFLAFVSRNPWYALFAIFFGYGFAWVGHFFVEKNRPATFQYPLWSLRGDFRMFGLTCIGKMDREVARLKVLNLDS